MRKKRERVLEVAGVLGELLAGEARLGGGGAATCRWTIGRIDRQTAGEEPPEAPAALEDHNGKGKRGPR